MTEENLFIKSRKNRTADQLRDGGFLGLTQALCG